MHAAEKDEPARALTLTFSSWQKRLCAGRTTRGGTTITPTVWKLRYLLAGAAIAALVFATTTALAGSSVTGMRAPLEAAMPLKKPKPVPPAGLAARLATGIHSAHTTTSRYAAILRVMSAIKLGVYDGKTGKALAKGLDTNKYDAYLMGGEVRSIAAALGGRKSFSTADLASLLTLVLGQQANPVPAQAANELVGGLVRVALGNPKKTSSSRPPACARPGPGERPPSRSRAGGRGAPIPLDAVQLELIEAYLLYPIIHVGSQRHSVQLRRPAARGTAVCKADQVRGQPLQPEHLSQLRGCGARGDRHSGRHARRIAWRQAVRGSQAGRDRNAGGGARRCLPCAGRIARLRPRAWTRAQIGAAVESGLRVRPLAGFPAREAPCTSAWRPSTTRC